MSGVSRRQFLREVSAGLFAFVPAIRLLAGDSKQSQVRDVVGELQGVDFPVDNYAEGIITAILSDKLIVRTERLGDIELHFSEESRVWKGDYEGTYSIEVNDYAYAWGTPREGGRRIDVEKIWLNIVHLRGTILSSESSRQQIQLTYLDKHTGVKTVELSEKVEVTLPSGEAVSPNIALFQDYQFAEVIGLRLNQEQILATRIWLG